MALENQRRIDQKLKPHASFSDWEKYRENNKDSADNDSTTPESDPILNEAAHILSDQIQLQTKPNAKLADIQKIH